MRFSFNLKDKVVDILKRSGKALTAREIAALIIQRHPADCEAKKARSRTPMTDEGLLGQIANEISGHLKKSPEIKTNDARPRRFAWNGTSAPSLPREATKPAPSSAKGAEPKLRLPARIKQFLSDRPGQGFKSGEIAQWILKTFPAECEAKRIRGPKPLTREVLEKQIRAEVTSTLPKLETRHPEVQGTHDSPRRWSWYEARTRKGRDEGRSPARGKSPPAENKLYPVLSDWLGKEYGIASKRINERRGSNRRGPGGNKWLFPDVVGVEDVAEKWNEEIKNLVKESTSTRAKLWSFEAKRQLQRSNVREAYFQAVSNSSWANYAYLVAARIDGKDTRQELQMLSTLHGVGVILIDPKERSGRIEIPARERPEVDWATCNRLAKENKEFQQFLELVLAFQKTGMISKNRWD